MNFPYVTLAAAVLLLYVLLVRCSCLLRLYAGHLRSIRNIYIDGSGINRLIGIAVVVLLVKRTEAALLGILIILSIALDEYRGNLYLNKVLIFTDN